MSYCHRLILFLFCESNTINNLVSILSSITFKKAILKANTIFCRTAPEKNFKSYIKIKSSLNDTLSAILS